VPGPPELVARRLPLYRAADDATRALGDATGLACPPGCGACCVTAPPHVTIGDVAPIAADLVARGEADAVLIRAEAAADGGACALHDPTRSGGGCTAYALRPVVCRLFGFAAVRDKRGVPHLAACRVHVREAPEATARAVAHVAAGGEVPVFADWQAAAHDGDGGAAQVPINAALARALDRELLRARLLAAGDPPPPGPGRPRVR